MYIFWDTEMSNLDADFGQILCWVAKTETGKKTVFRFDQQLAHRRKFDPTYSDQEIAAQIRDYLDASVGDVWVTYNGKRFDVPYINTRLIIHGEKPLDKGMHHDPLYSARFRLKLSSNRLDTVAKTLRVDASKTAIEPQYWVPALRGHKPSMDYVVDHCERDVEVLEQVFNKLRCFVDKIAKQGMA